MENLLYACSFPRLSSSHHRHAIGNLSPFDAPYPWVTKSAHRHIASTLADELREFAPDSVTSAVLVRQRQYRWTTGIAHYAIMTAALLRKLVRMRLCALKAGSSA